MGRARGREFRIHCHRHCLEPNEVAVEGDVGRVRGRGRVAVVVGAVAPRAGEGGIPAYAGLTVEALRGGEE